MVFQIIFKARMASFPASQDGKVSQVLAQVRAISIDPLLLHGVGVSNVFTCVVSLLCRISSRPRLWLCDSCLFKIY